MKKPCAVCGVPSEHNRCPKHPRENSHGRRVPRQQRGYDAAYEAARRELYRQARALWDVGVAPVCALCGRRILYPIDWSADHLYTVSGIPDPIQCIQEVGKRHDDLTIDPADNRPTQPLGNLASGTANGRPVLRHAHKTCQHAQGGRIARHAKRARQP